MKNINVVFEDEEFNLLLSCKGDLSWHDFILTIIELKKQMGELKNAD